jgi:hypothetical protein
VTARSAGRALAALLAVVPLAGCIFAVDRSGQWGLEKRVQKLEKRVDRLERERGVEPPAGPGKPGDAHRGG